uniref:Uncharacterized protein n=1 Tax=Xenopus tropicalis TaxID=8364 RepID=F7BH28_XENTR
MEPLNKLSCSVCLGIYRDPVTLPCGHTYCRVCIGRTWEEQGESPSCPECRHRYRSRPELSRNLALSSIVESFCPTAPEQGEPGIYCTDCAPHHVTACSTCLLCNVSLCYKHAREHGNCAEHELTAPTPSQRDRYCPKHPELLLDYYCPRDGVCICAWCYRVGEHRGHRVEPLNEASEKKKEKLREVLLELSPEREETEREAQKLQERRREGAGKAAGETERVTALFRDIRKWLEALEKRLLRDISREQEKVSLKLHDLIHQLEIKKDELSRKICHIEELCNMAGPLTVLQAREPDGAEFYEAEGGDRKRRKMEDINAPAVGDLDVGRISETLLTGLEQIVTGVKGWQFPGQEATDLVLDINTEWTEADLSP